MGVVDCFFFQAEDGIRAFHVTGVQTCALPILLDAARACPPDNLALEVRRNTTRPRSGISRPNRRLLTPLRPQERTDHCVTPPSTGASPPLMRIRLQHLSPAIHRDWLLAIVDSANHRRTR